MGDPWRLTPPFPPPTPQERTVASTLKCTNPEYELLAFTTSAARYNLQGALMGLEEDIVKLLKSEGYRINEAIKDALDEFLDTVNDENEDMEEDLEDDAKEDEEND
jgi:hypothetical protein